MCVVRPNATFGLLAVPPLDSAARALCALSICDRLASSLARWRALTAMRALSVWDVRTPCAVAAVRVLSDWDVRTPVHASHVAAAAARIAARLSSGRTTALGSSGMKLRPGGIMNEVAVRHLLPGACVVPVLWR